MNVYYESELYHHGIKGMKWGRRRYQNSDGSLTPAGKSRYVTVSQANRNIKKAQKEAIKTLNKSPEKHTMHQYSKAVKAAGKQSLANDKARNKQARQAKKAAKEQALKTHQKSLNEYYSGNNAKADLNYYLDRRGYGKKGIERISKRMDKGLSSTSARAIESGRQWATGMLVATGGMAVASIAVNLYSNKKYLG